MFGHERGDTEAGKTDVIRQLGIVQWAWAWRECVGGGKEPVIRLGG